MCLKNAERSDSATPPKRDMPGAAARKSSSGFETMARASAGIHLSASTDAATSGLSICLHETESRQYHSDKKFENLPAARCPTRWLELVVFSTRALVEFKLLACHRHGDGAIPYMARASSFLR